MHNDAIESAVPKGLKDEKGPTPSNGPFEKIFRTVFADR